MDAGREAYVARICHPIRLGESAEQLLECVDVVHTEQGKAFIAEDYLVLNDGSPYDICIWLVCFEDLWEIFVGNRSECRQPTGL